MFGTSFGLGHPTLVKTWSLTTMLLVRIPKQLQRERSTPNSLTCLGPWCLPGLGWVLEILFFKVQVDQHCTCSDFSAVTRDDRSAICSSHGERKEGDCCGSAAFSCWRTGHDHVTRRCGSPCCQSANELFTCGGCKIFTSSCIKPTGRLHLMKYHCGYCWRWRMTTILVNSPNTSTIHPLPDVYVRKPFIFSLHLQHTDNWPVHFKCDKSQQYLRWLIHKICYYLLSSTYAQMYQ